MTSPPSANTISQRPILPVLDVSGGEDETIPENLPPQDAPLEDQPIQTFLWNGKAMNEKQMNYMSNSKLYWNEKNRADMLEIENAILREQIRKLEEKLNGNATQPY